MKTKLLLILFIATNLLSCSKDSSDDQTSSFTFQVEVQNVTDRSATITWTRPEGSNISYQIFLNNELIEDNFSQTAYTFNGLTAETSYNGKITASNGSQTTSVNFSFLTKDYVPNIYEGNVELSNQQAVNDFGSHHYDEIRGSLTIGYSDINDLNPLNDLKVVYGDVNFISLAFESFEGIGKLNHIGGKLYFYNNQNLKNLNGLESITHITGNIEFYADRKLEDISGLRNVTEFKGGLQVEDTKIREIKILQDATQLENLYLGFNRKLNNISGLRNVTEIGAYLDIDLNEELLNFDDLGSIKHIRGYAHISSPSITNIGFVNLESVGEELNINFTPEITNLNDLSNLRSFGSLEIWANSKLGDFCGISTAVVNMNMPIVTESNKFNPTLEDFKNGNCSQ